MQRPRQSTVLLAAKMNRKLLFDALHAAVILENAHAAVSLTELAEEHLRRIALGDTPDKDRSHSPVLLDELFALRLEAYSPEQTRSRQALECARQFFVSRFGRDADAAKLTDDLVERALADRKNPVSWNSLFRRLRLVLNWGVSHGWLKESPLHRLVTKPVPWCEPSFFLPDRVERIFRMAESHPGPLDGAIGAQLSLGFFAGVRTAEILRLRWCDLDLDGGTLRIPFPKGHTNGLRPRIVELEPCAVAWLRLWRNFADIATTEDAAQAPIVRKPWRLRDWKARWLAPRGDSWGNDSAHNVMRHTYATMHVAAFRDAAATALNLGHGRDSGMLERHYRGLVSRSVAEPFWRIFPSGDSFPIEQPKSRTQASYAFA